ncbi:MAG TPA: BON domain-containing protein [Gemmatimonadaceae bacterium]|nr:BON domain-containing protein [Gemmatimonadaceae bacterium]
MKKTDLELQRDVINEIHWDPSADGEIGVAAKDGVITLSGTVNSHAHKFSVIRAAERVFGVKAIAEDLVVKLPTSALRSDTDIAHAAVAALKWNVQVPPDRLMVRVDDGWLVLEGSVDWEYQRKAADESIRSLTGVKGVTNSITITQRPAAGDVRRRIEEALKRSAEVDARHVSVETRDGRVVLRGTVRSWTERKDAERAAWSAPGVTAVEDQLAISVPVLPA